jgi:hypothetical protein
MNIESLILQLVIGMFPVWVQKFSGWAKNREFVKEALIYSQKRA